MISQPGGQRRTGDVVLGQITDCSYLPGFKDRDDVGMCQQGGGTSLSQKSLSSGGMEQHIRAGNFEGNKSVKHRIASQKDDPFSSHSQAAQHLKTAEVSIVDSEQRLGIQVDTEVEIVTTGITNDVSAEVA